MVRAIGLLMVSAVLLSWTAVHAQTTVEREATRVATDEKAERLPDTSLGGREAAAEMLRRRVESVDWRDSTFEAVLDWLKDQGEGRVNVVAKWAPLGVESVNQESPINLSLNNTTVADVLTEVMDQLSPEDGQIQFRGVGNKLTISSKQDFERRMYLRVYDVTDLLFQVTNFGENAPLIDLQNAGRSSGGGGGGGGGQSVFQGSGGSGGERGQGSQQEDQLNKTRLDEYRALIEATVAPESWDLSGSTNTGGQQQTGGGRGRIRVIGRSLVVLNTIEVHEMIAGKFSFAE